MLGFQHGCPRSPVVQGLGAFCGVLPCEREQFYEISFASPRRPALLAPLSALRCQGPWRENRSASMLAVTCLQHSP